MKNKLILLLVLGVTIFSCKKASKNQKNRIELSDTKLMSYAADSTKTIHTEKSKEINTDTFLKMIKTINYIPLGTEEFIGEISKMIVTDDKVIILDSFVSTKIFAFDKQGKLLFCIKNKGQGPEDYISLWDIQIDADEKYIIANDALAKKYIYYSAEDGRFVKKENSIANCYMALLNGKYINMLTNGQDFNLDEDWAVVVTDKDSVLYKAFELTALQKDDYIVNSFQYDIDGGLLYTPINSDTIYQFISESAYSPKYVISQNKSIWELYKILC